MIEQATGNLLHAEVEALVNTVNTVGIMGKGIALQFRRAFPDNYRAYAAAARRGQIRIGEMFVTETQKLHGPRLIINFPTKKHWRARSRLADIDAGLLDLRRVLIEREVSSVAVPPLGCGLGGLRWGDVRPRIEDALADLDVRVLLYAPEGAPEPDDMSDETPRPSLTAARAALIRLLARYHTPEEPTSPLEVQKLLYFLQTAGEPLQLAFKPHRFGPYADAARHAVQRLEGHYVMGYGDGTGRGSIHVLPGAADEAEAVLGSDPSSAAHFDRVDRLIDGFETAYGLELLGTTHWVVEHEGARDPERAADLVRKWSDRKGRLFTDHHVRAAWDRLTDQGWITNPDAAETSSEARVAKPVTRSER